MKPLMVSGQFPCIRVGKITEALRIGHDALCRMRPPQMEYIYDNLYALRCATQKEMGEWFQKNNGRYDLIHIHNEPNWPVVIAKEYQDAPVLMNVHDVTSARPLQADSFEEAAFQAADAFVFISDWQRDFCIKIGLDVKDKPYCILSNYASDSTIVEKPLLPKIGGVVYIGGLDKRGLKNSWRDLSPVADEMEKRGIPFHVFPGNPGIDYGIVHQTIMEYSVITHRMAQYDWGFSGTMMPNEAWHHSYPNKVFEYFAAGIPVLALNNPLIKQFCDEGLGIYLPDEHAIRGLERIDPKPYAKRVREQRHRFTMSYNIKPLQDLYKELRG